MSIINKIFKSKLDQRQFEFKEEYWKDLEKKLDAHGGKGVSNYGKWFFYSIGIVTILSVAVWFFYPKAEDAQVAVTAISDGGNNAIGENGNPTINNISLKVDTKSEKRSPVSVNENNSFENGIFPKPGMISRPAPKAEAIVKRDLSNISLKNGSGTKKPQENLFHDKENSFGKKESAIGISSSSFTENTETQIGKLPGSNSSEPENTIITASADMKTPMLLMGKIFPVQMKNYESELQTTAFEIKTGRRKNSYFAGVYSGVMYTDKKLKANYDSLGEFISRRKNEETWMLSKNLGADFGIGQDCWNISIGINYQQQGEVVDYKPEFYQWLKKSTSSWNIVDNSFWKNDTVNTFSFTVTEGSWQSVDTTIGYWSNNIYVPSDTISIQQYVVDSEYIQTIYVTDSNYVSKFDTTGENIQIDSTNQLVNDPSLKPGKTTTKISYFEFPVMVGYEFPVSRFSVILRTGFSVGLLSKFSATYLKNDISGTEQVDISRLNKTMLNYLLKAGVLFYVTENTVINFEPIFRMNLNSVFKDSGFTQKYWNVGLNLGVMYRF